MNRSIRRGPVSVTHRGSISPVRRVGSSEAQSLGQWMGSSLDSASSDSSSNTDPGFNTERSTEEDEDPGNDVWATGEF